MGGTLLENILSNDKLFEKIYEFKGTDLNIFIKTKESYINKFIISSINMTQLPLLTEPRKIEENSEYYSPYISPELFHNYNSFDTVVKPKFDQREKSEISSTISKCIEFLNSIKFKINLDVLYFISNEWQDANSNLFKGKNI